ncbi:hypothetical protein A3H16_02715 [Candidatus Kaiserbacteria bacterium RIFCSPLOWO2_12_FULL_53_8]|uniref:PIN domain-containing protein n=1 Tax=Candidatus Kaiserbacteria bacterium RIFCSPLOWO2_12_FULL_53_8 TaxID=1798529 RepID=A0A1F6G1E8_9BACT|nr:MAG: hypothetical protein A3H16_02715 [Candidatus Kaiserbacteria bacterium RIFCSPLOWO2_12_FULL_53_8]
MSTAETIVVDSSVMVKWCSEQDEQHLEQASLLLKQCAEGIISIAIPELAHYEVGNALLKGKGLSINAMGKALSFLYDLPLISVPESLELAEQTYRIAVEDEISYYDASFLSLALLLRAPLITENVKHQGKAKQVKVIPLSSYC